MNKDSYLSYSRKTAEIPFFSRARQGHPEQVGDRQKDLRLGGYSLKKIWPRKEERIAMAPPHRHDKRTIKDSRNR